MWILMLVGGSLMMHFYIWLRLVYDAGVPKTLKIFFALLFILFTALIPLRFYYRHLVPGYLDHHFHLFVFTWLAVVFLLMSVRLFIGIIPFTAKIKNLVRDKKPLDESRRQFLSRIAAGGTLAVGTPLLLYGGSKAFEDPQILEIPVKINNLNSKAHGLSIVQLTDIHITESTPVRFISRLVERVNSLKPDLVAITGDMVDGSVPAIGNKVNILGDLKSRFGTFFVTGNHEYYVGVTQWLNELKKLKINNLNNAGLEIDEYIWLTGIPDPATTYFGYSAPPDVNMAVEKNKRGLPTVLLAHQPKAVTGAAVVNADLQISGHTHGGQIQPFGALVMLSQPYISGLHQHTDKTQIYVSRGTGTWGPPIRIGAPSEISKIVLT